MTKLLNGVSELFALGVVLFFLSFLSFIIIAFYMNIGPVLSHLIFLLKRLKSLLGMFKY